MDCLKKVGQSLSIVLYACEGRTLDRVTVEKLRVWEGRLLAILTGRRKRKEEEGAVHTKSRLLTGGRRFHEGGFQTVVQRFVKKPMGLGHGRHAVCCPKVLF
eukprot:8512892-Pyramimonas_sp.AAC.1